MKYLIIDAFNFSLISAAASIRNGLDLNITLDKSLKKLCFSFTGYKVYSVFDTYGGTDFRRKINPDYKLNRDNSFYDFKAIESTNIVYSKNDSTNIYVPKCEADDAIFILCKIIKEKDPNSNIVIVSRDHDLIQVVQAGYADKIWDNVKKQYLEIPDYSIVDMKSLVGDKSDGISGVPKIGEKTALKVLRGEQKLTEDQHQIFERCKDIIDATRHPKFNENYNYIKETYKEVI